MTDGKDNKGVSGRCTTGAQEITALVDYAVDSIVSKTIIDAPAGTITLFAFDKGQRLSEHTASYDAVVQILDGKAQLTIQGRSFPAKAGEIIIMPANIPHAVTANERCKMLLTMIRA